MKKLLFVIALFILLSANTAFTATYVSDTYTDTFTLTIDSTYYATLQSCYIEDYYTAGKCDWWNINYVIVEKGVTDFKYAVQKEYVDMTDQQTGSIDVTFVPPQGKVYMIATFIGVVHYTQLDAAGLHCTWQGLVNEAGNWVYQHDDGTVCTTTNNWEAIPEMIEQQDLKIISRCPEGKILRDNLCFDYNIVCANTMSTNMCDNPYKIYCLDYGFGCEMEKTNQLCSDRDEDRVCDTVYSHTCSDVNMDDVCDIDNLWLSNLCYDEQGNYVCDDVETAGTFCTLEYQPVCWMQTIGPGCTLSEECAAGLYCIMGICTQAVTYPNECFAIGAGKTSYTIGECIPQVEQIQCRVDADCPAPCQGIAAKCLSFQCEYMGECNPQLIQCSIASDCPQPYCRGVTVECNELNRCEFAGRCVTQPQAPSWWELVGLWLWDTLIKILSGKW